MKIEILGSGTSTGIPVPGCACTVCSSEDPRDKRLRTSIIIREIGPAKSSNILVDSSPDFRFQALRADIKSLDAVLYTHTHADHIYGLDDLRCYCFNRESALPVYASEKSAADLERIFYYAFHHDPDYQGGSRPNLSMNIIQAYKELEIAGAKILPLTLFHGRSEILGFRIANFAYLTDCSRIPEETYSHLQGIEYLVLDGLRFRPHPTHFNFEQAVKEAEKIGAKETYLIHMSHDVTHQKANQELAQMTDLPIQLAYDQLILDCS